MICKIMLLRTLLPQLLWRTTLLLLGEVSRGSVTSSHPPGQQMQGQREEDVQQSRWKRDQQMSRRPEDVPSVPSVMVPVKEQEESRGGFSQIPMLRHNLKIL